MKYLPRIYVIYLIVCSMTFGLLTSIASAVIVEEKRREEREEKGSGKRRKEKERKGKGSHLD